MGDEEEVKRIYIVAAITVRPGEFPGIETVFRVTPNLQNAQLCLIDVVKESQGIDEALKIMHEITDGIIVDNVKIQANDEVVYQLTYYDATIQRRRF